MKKVWVYKRNDIKGWWCGWYESGKRKAKTLPSRELAEHYKHIKYTQLNSDGLGALQFVEVWLAGGMTMKMIMIVHCLRISVQRWG